MTIMPVIVVVVVVGIQFQGKKKEGIKVLGKKGSRQSDERRLEQFGSDRV